MSADGCGFAEVEPGELRGNQPVKIHTSILYIMAGFWLFYALTLDRSYCNVALHLAASGIKAVGTRECGLQQQQQMWAKRMMIDRPCSNGWQIVQSSLLNQKYSGER
jgi:hypothetical protein